jgi:hypothetical protein
MRARVIELGGELKIDTGPAGTTLKVRLPVHGIAGLEPCLGPPISLAPLPVALREQKRASSADPSPRTGKSLAKSRRPGPGDYAAP